MISTKSTRFANCGEPGFVFSLQRLLIIHHSIFVLRGFYIKSFIRSVCQHACVDT